MSKDAALNGSGDFRERSLALAISVALHVAAFGWICLVGDQSGWGRSESLGHSNGDGTSADFLAPDEFRQRIETIPTNAASVIPDASERPLENEKSLPADRAVDAPEDGEFVDPAEHPTSDLAAVQEAGVDPAESMEAGVTQGKENAGGRNDNNGLRAAYLAALRAAIRQHWNYQGSRQQCSLTIKQSSRGAVESATSGDCKLSTQDQRSLEAAALMAQPLPYAGFESVYSDTLSLDFHEH